MKIPTLEQLDRNQPLIQLGLLNFALIVILLKNIGFLYSVCSFVLIFIIVSLVYHHVLRHGEGGGELLIFDEDLARKLGDVKAGWTEKLANMGREREDKKKNTLLIVILLLI